MQAANARRAAARHLFQTRRTSSICRYSTQNTQPRPTTAFLSRAVPYALGLGVATAIGVFFFYPDQYRGAPTSETVPLAPTHFTPALILSNEYSGPDTKILELQVPLNLLPEDKSTTFAPIWSVYIKDDDIQVERPYTPLEGIDEAGKMRFWIKKYPTGEVGRWLHTKSPGQKIELRGPLSTWVWKDEVWDEVVMISGGTGFTPFYQLFHSIISQPSSSRTRFTLLHSSRVPSQLPPAQLLDPLFAFAEQNSDKLRVQLFVDTLDDGPSSRNSLNLKVTRIGRLDIEETLGLRRQQPSWWARMFGRTAPLPTIPGDKKIMFLVCGPDPMISAISGPWGRNFSQGPVRGVLGEMGCSSDQVRKL